MNIKDWSANAKLAAGLTLVLVAWMALGVISGNQGLDKKSQPEEKMFSVQVERISSTEYRKSIFVRGRTEANRSVLVAAEIDGLVVQTPAVEGQNVEVGEALCVLESKDRILRVEQAKALKNKATIEYEGALSLKDRGYQSKAQIATAKSSLALAEAGVKAATIAMEKLTIRAPFSGIVQERRIEQGGFAQRGSPCVLLIELTPLLVVGNIPESAVMSLSVGDAAKIVLLNGSTRDGVVRYISRAADAVTRTFKIEVELPNLKNELIEGLSAEITLAAEPINAHHVSPSLLSLLDDGNIGLKVLEDNNLVVHRSIEIVGDDADGVWVTGLAETTTLIIVGHEYVAVNSRVTIASSSASSSGVAAPTNLVAPSQSDAP